MSTIHSGLRFWQRRAVMAFAMLALGGGASSVHAQAQAPYPPGPPTSLAETAGDPPGRVARLSDATGQVWLSSLDSPEWIAADRNRPLTSGDRLAVDKGGRAELSLGSTTLRLDGGTELEVAQLDDTRFVVQLLTGSVAARLRNPQSLDEFELDTDEGRFRVLQAGRFRFDRDARSSDVTVYGGQAVFEGRGSALPVNPGQHAEFWLDAAGAAQYNMVAPERDAFATWNDERDRAEDRYAAGPSRFVSPEMTGAQDLERYGAWQQDPDYGSIWIPRDVPSDWAPYSTGHWAWVRPWGWTWVDDAAWGFAPFHYGRWVNRRNVWCWTPGTYVARPVYAPALVAWVGGPRANVSISIGGRGRGDAPVGWFPLGPREVFVPSYRHSPRYVRNINIVNVTNVVNITNIVENRGGAADRRTFVNRDTPHALTVVQANVFVNREPVRGNASRFGDSSAMRALMDQRASPVLIAAPVATPPPVPPRGNGGEMRQRPPGFAVMPRNDRPDRGGDPRGERADRAGDPRGERSDRGDPRGERADRRGDPGGDRGGDRGGVGRSQPGTAAMPQGQPNLQGQAAQPNPFRGGGQPVTVVPPTSLAPSARPPVPVQPAVVVAPITNAPQGAVDGRADPGRNAPGPQGRDRFGDRPQRPTTAYPINGSVAGPAAAPVQAPATRPEPQPQAAPSAAPVIPPPRERFQRPATPSERTPPPNSVAPAAPPAPVPGPAVDNNRRPTPQATEDARAVQRAERAERRERGEPGQAPATPRGPEAGRPAPTAVAPPPVVRAAPPARPGEARSAEAPHTEPPPRAEAPPREERR